VELVSRRAQRIVAIGEGMIEARADGSLGWGGDAVNTALYLARQGAAPALLSAMGADDESDAVVEAWAAEGVGVAHVLRDPARRAGRYRITLGAAGQRSFTYDRDRSAARAFFGLPGAADALAWAAEADILFLTGVTLSIYGPEERARLAELAGKVRARGGKVAFDPNYRPAGWPSAAEAWRAMAALAPALSLVLPSIEDHERLAGPAEPEAAARAWLALGVEEAVVKLGAEGALAARQGETARAPAAPAPHIVDTTAAGDAFNAGYIAARLLAGAPMAAALAHAAALAAETVAWPGAIAPAHVGRRAFGA